MNRIWIICLIIPLTLNCFHCGQRNRGIQNQPSAGEKYRLATDVVLFAEASLDKPVIAHISKGAEVKVEDFLVRDAISGQGDLLHWLKVESSSGKGWLCNFPGYLCQGGVCPEIKCTHGDCASGRGEKQFGNSFVYKGNFRNGFFEGNGQLFQGNLLVYDGNFRNGVFHGTGEAREYIPAERTYRGEFLNGLKHGQGQYTSEAEGVRYSGEYQFNYYNGNGTMTHRVYGEYRGNWEKGVQNGQGEIVRRNGERISGNFRDGWICRKGDCENGSGVYENFNASTYEGGFLQGKFSGKGHLVASQDGRVVYEYTGEFRNGLFHGDGKIEYKESRSVYSGYWKDGKRHGLGSSIFGNTMQTGYWLEDKFVGRVKPKELEE